MRHAAACVLLVLAACGGGSDGDSSADAATGADAAGGADAPPGGSFTIAVDTDAVDSELQATNQVGVTVTPVDGFSGTVALSAAGLPDTVTADFTPADVDLSSGPAEAVLSVTVPSTITPTSTPTTITVTGDGGAGTTASDTFALTVQRAITIYIVPDASTAELAFGPRPIVIHAGTIALDDTIQVRFYNQDSVPHEVHAAQDESGFPHDQTLIAPDSYDSLIRQVIEPGVYPFYLHDLGDEDGPTTGNQLEIETP